MHVEIDDRDALGPVRPLRLSCRDRGIVEKAKTHGAGAFGVMPRGARPAKRIAHLACHHRIDGLGGGAHGVQDGWPGMRGKIGIGIDMGDAPVARDELGQGLAIALLMGKQGQFGGAGRGLPSVERGKTRILEHAPEGAQAIRALGMAGRSLVLEADRVREIERGHGSIAALALVQERSSYRPAACCGPAAERWLRAAAARRASSMRSGRGIMLDGQVVRRIGPDGWAKPATSVPVTRMRRSSIFCVRAVKPCWQSSHKQAT